MGDDRGDARPHAARAAPPRAIPAAREPDAQERPLLSMQNVLLGVGGAALAGMFHFYKRRNTAAFKACWALMCGACGHRGARHKQQHRRNAAPTSDASLLCLPRHPRLHTPGAPAPPLRRWPTLGVGVMLAVQPDEQQLTQVGAWHGARVAWGAHGAGHAWRRGPAWGQGSVLRCPCLSQAVGDAPPARSMFSDSRRGPSQTPPPPSRPPAPRRWHKHAHKPAWGHSALPPGPPSPPPAPKGSLRCGPHPAPPPTSPCPSSPHQSLPPDELAKRREANDAIRRMAAAAAAAGRHGGGSGGGSS